MSGTYLTALAEVLRAAGCNVVEYDGWKNRARSSGGYAAMPLAVMWHHTASNTSPQNDANYMCNGSSDRPIANILIARNGDVWVLAAGATNTNGKGGPLTFSRGTVPVDGMNTRALGCEIANSGVGEQYSQAQADAMFKVSNACNAQFGNQPTDLATHQVWAPTRKIDPATTDIAGPWQPSASTSSGTWNLNDIRAECERRAVGDIPPPDPPPDPEPEPEPIRIERITDMLHVIAPDRGATLIGPMFRHFAGSPDEPIVFERAYGPPVQLSNYDYDLLVEAVFVNNLPKSQGGPF